LRIVEDDAVEWHDRVNKSISTLPIWRGVIKQSGAEWGNPAPRASLGWAAILDGRRSMRLIS
jgi:hypothetical protein